SDIDDFLAKSAGMHLDGILDRINVPFLVVHGERDRQIPLEYAHRTYDALVNSPRRELKILTAREGGVEHVGADNMTFARDYIADGFAGTVGGSAEGYSGAQRYRVEHPFAVSSRDTTPADDRSSSRTGRRRGSRVSAASSGRCFTRFGTRAR